MMHVAPRIDLKKVRKDFPMLSAEMNGRPLVYLDNAATTQKPLAVIERMDRFLRQEYANVHRGIYTFSQESTRECDEAREKCRGLLNASSASEILFVRGATEAANLVAAGYGRKHLKPGDEILVTETEHHSNYVPWQALAKEKGLVFKVAPVNDRGEIDLESFERMLGPRTYFVAVGHVSNALGSVHPVEEITRMAHHAGAVVFVDGAQAVPHLPVDVRAMDCDFYCFSGHKLYGPTGIGVLYAKAKHLEAMDPYQYGGDMIETVAADRSTWAKAPAKFEAGTPAIAEIIGLGAAIDYIRSIGYEAIEAAEKDLLDYATERLNSVPGLRIIGTAERKASLVSFVFDAVHPHDVGTVLNEEGIAVRAGHHCAMPTMRRFGVPATTRASFAFYNTREEVDALVKGLGRVLEIFR